MGAKLTRLLLTNAAKLQSQALRRKPSTPAALSTRAEMILLAAWVIGLKQGTRPKLALFRSDHPGRLHSILFRMIGEGAHHCPRGARVPRGAYPALRSLIVVRDDYFALDRAA